LSAGNTECDAFQALMAIQWFDNIASIKKVLSEAGTSARLKAVHSLELLLSQEALDLLREVHPNAISFEKFFVERAIKTLEGYLDSGEIPERITRSKERSDRIALSLSETGDSPELEEAHGVGLTDLEDSLRPRSEIFESGLSPTPLSEENESEWPSSPNLEVKKAEIALGLQPLASEPSISNEAAVEEEEVSSDLSHQILNTPDSKLEYSEENRVESENYDDYLPSLTSGETENSYPELLPPMADDGTDGEYDDLLPPLRLQDEGEIYEDLLPPMKEASEDAGDYDDLLPELRREGDDTQMDSDYEGLLPPLEKEESSSNFDDLLPPMSEVESVGPVQEDYDDLLPPLQTGDSLEVSVDDLPANDPSLSMNYDELLPPLKEESGDVAEGNLGNLESVEDSPIAGKPE
jgi:hypothetical protein